MTASETLAMLRQSLTQLRLLADAELASLVAVLEGSSPERFRQGIVDVLPELLTPYMSAAGDLTAVVVESLRAEAALRGTFYAEAAPAVVDSAKLHATAAWAVQPLTNESLGSTPLSRLTGASARLIFDASRDTVAVNTGRDGAAYYQRMPRPGCCAFCGMLASRPAWMGYRSEASAGGVVGRGADVSRNFNTDGSQRVFGNRMAKGVRARGSREVGSSTHDDCHCVVIPVYPGTDMAALAGASQRQYQEMYQQSLTGENNEPLDGTKAILSEWRKYHGTK